MSTAFVLSGGGSRGDFQVGAIRALADRNIYPDIICGTSVGAINAMMLTQNNGLERLERIWFGMTSNQQMWDFETWWQQLPRMVRTLLQKEVNGLGTLNLNKSSALPNLLRGATQVGVGLLAVAGPIALPLLLLGGGVAASELEKLINLLTNNARALFNLQPVRRLFGSQFNLAEFDGWVASGKKLRLASCDLNSGDVVYFSETKKLLDRNGAELGDGISIVDAAIASSSIGTFFPPVAIRGFPAEGPRPPVPAGQYIDGGHRENLPLKAAIDAGATNIFIIGASPLAGVSTLNKTEEGDVSPDYSHKHLLDIAGRALLDMSLEEVAMNDVMARFPTLRPKGKRITQITPNYPTHDILTIDPELIRINYEYGYRTANDVLDGASQRDRDLSDNVALDAGRAARMRRSYVRGSAVAQHSVASVFDSQADKARASLRPVQANTKYVHPMSMTSRLRAGERLLVGQSLASPDGQTTLTFTDNGLLAVVGPNPTLIGNAFADAYMAVLEFDGTFRTVNRDFSVTGFIAGPFGEGATFHLNNDGSFDISAKGIVRYNSAGQITPRDISISVRNDSPTQAMVQFLDPLTQRDVIPEETLQSGEAKTVTIANGLSEVLTLWNGWHEITVEGDETAVYDFDERIRVRNDSPGTIQVVFRQNGVPDTLPVGCAPSAMVFHFPQSSTWGRSTEIDVLVDGALIGSGGRGSRFAHATRRISITNSSRAPVTFHFYDPTDSIMLVDMLGTLPLTLPPGSTGSFTHPHSGPYTKIGVKGPGVLPPTIAQTLARADTKHNFDGRTFIQIP